MEFRNLTPFDAMCFAALDVDNELQRVVVMKVAYKIVRQANIWQALVMDQDPEQLCTADQFFGQPGQSSIAQESDLAPYKPKCDVLIKGYSHAPQGKPAKSWPARIRISALETPEVVQPQDVPKPQPLNPLMPLTAEQVSNWRREQARAQKTADDINQATAQRQAQANLLLDKTLIVSGESEFTLGPLGGWQRSSPELATKVALQWEHSFGGSSVVPDPKTPGQFLLNEVCYANPIGTGWIDKRESAQRSKAKLHTRSSVAAPQIEPPQKPVKEPLFVEHPKPKAGEEITSKRMAEIAANYDHQPVGFGPVGRAWAPRLALAGSYDDKWRKQAHPSLPKDFNEAFWNGAPQDQQTQHLPQSLRVELWNLCGPTQSANQNTNGHIQVELPGHRPFVLMRLDTGAMAPIALKTDTLLIDTEAMTISLTHRMRLPDSMPIRVLEARFEIDPSAPLIKFKREPKPKQQLQAAG